MDDDDDDDDDEASYHPSDEDDDEPAAGEKEKGIKVKRRKLTDAEQEAQGFYEEEGALSQYRKTVDLRIEELQKEIELRTFTKSGISMMDINEKLTYIISRLSKCCMSKYVLF